MVTVKVRIAPHTYMTVWMSVVTPILKSSDKFYIWQACIEEPNGEYVPAEMSEVECLV